LPVIPEASEELENTEDSTILEELSTTEEPVTPEESNKLKEHIKTPKKPLPAFPRRGRILL
jgi:hypothetical protein